VPLGLSAPPVSYDARRGNATKVLTYIKQIEALAQTLLTIERVVGGALLAMLSLWGVLAGSYDLGHGTAATELETF
jgi:hypothetical protein